MRGETPNGWSLLYGSGLLFSNAALRVRVDFAYTANPRSRWQGIHRWMTVLRMIDRTVAGSFAVVSGCIAMIGERFWRGRLPLRAGAQYPMREGLSWQYIFPAGRRLKYRYRAGRRGPRSAASFSLKTMQVRCKKRSGQLASPSRRPATRFGTVLPHICCSAADIRTCSTAGHKKSAQDDLHHCSISRAWVRSALDEANEMKDERAVRPNGVRGRLKRGWCEAGASRQCVPAWSLDESARCGMLCGA